jgi:hypothetical protein
MNKKLALSVEIILIVLLIAAAIVRSLYLKSGYDPRICEMLGGRFTSCSSSNCPPGALCPEVCGPSECIF